ncbi:MAG: hypothetical protein HFJ38_01780 [Bacilli bacterium]|nr:hypothetical protein [Bacilli bacterium]
MEKFNYEINGYNREEVNSFVDEVTNNTREIVEKCVFYQEEIEKLKKELEQYRKRTNEIDLLFEKAEFASKNIKNMAEKEAEIIIREAKENASVIINDSLVSAQKIDIRKDLVCENMQRFREKLRVLIEQEKMIADELDHLDISDE